MTDFFNIHRKSGKIANLATARLQTLLVIDFRPEWREAEIAGRFSRYFRCFRSRSVNAPENRPMTTVTVKAVPRSETPDGDGGCEEQVT